MESKCPVGPVCFHSCNYTNTGKVNIQTLKGTDTTLSTTYPSSVTSTKKLQVQTTSGALAMTESTDMRSAQQSTFRKLAGKR